MSYLTRIEVLALIRGLDLVTTWLASPDLKLERNPILSALGWRWVLVVNAAVLPLLALSIQVTAIVCALSFVAALVNLKNVRYD